jgi:hypothetical protein
MTPRLARLNDLLSATEAQLSRPDLDESAVQRLNDLKSATQAEIDASAKERV